MSCSTSWLINGFFFLTAWYTNAQLTHMPYPAKTILLDPQTSHIILSDYLGEIDALPTFEFPAGISASYDSISSKMIITSEKNIAPLMPLKVDFGSKSLVLLLQKSQKQKTIFTVPDPNHEYERVNLVGDINAWNPANTAMIYRDSLWIAELYLLPGTYGYQLVINGVWQLDSANPHTMDNGIGGLNSKLVVPSKYDGTAPELQTDRETKDGFSLKLKGNIDQVFVLWQDSLLTTTRENDQLTIKIPQIARDIKRSYIKAIGYNDTGVSNEVIVPLDYGRVLKDPEKLCRYDKETNIMYYIMIDRFWNGNRTNDRPLDDDEVYPIADFHGGDLHGVFQKLKQGYFDSIGITSIWLSPIIKNPEGKFGLFNKGGIKSKFSAYHGYWPISFTEIDARFGDKAILKKIISEAHRRGINIILDYVANHVHEHHPLYIEHPDIATQLYLSDGTLNTEKWDEYRLTTWFDTFLPTLDLQKEQISEMLSDSMLFWIEKYDIDGFRHDATKHIPLSFWRKLTKKINAFGQQTGKVILQIGETYGTPELINSYINAGKLDGQFDFNVYDAILAALCREDVGFDRVAEKIKESLLYYGYHNLMGYMTGNQDKPRFMALATQEVRLDEDTKLAGWSRNIDRKTKRAYKKLLLMHAFIQTIPGIPVIYYGDEIGMTGGNDPDNRRDMKFDNLDTAQVKLKQNVKRLANWRRSHPVFLFGDFSFEIVEFDFLVYKRKYFDQTVYIILNNSEESKQFDIPNLASSTPSAWMAPHLLKERTITVPPYNFEIIHIRHDKI